VAGETDGGVDRGREALLRALRDGGVRFVLIGGAAIESHGVPYATQDIDVTPVTSKGRSLRHQR
jgi:predicted nucleotidyltransferase